MLLLESLKKEYIEIDNKLISYSVNGYGYPVVLIHGLGTSKDSWSFNIKELSQDSKVYAVDMPGFGESCYDDEVLSAEEIADTIAKWCLKIGIKKANFVGHSFGGEVCLWLAIKYPNIVKSLVLAASTGLNDNVSNIERIKSMMIDGPREPIHFMPKLFKSYIKAGAWRIIATLQKSHQRNLGIYLNKIKCPVLIIYGSKDPIIIPEEDYICVKKIKNFQIKIINSTHGLIFDSPEEFNLLVKDFVNN